MSQFFLKWISLHYQLGGKKHTYIMIVIMWKECTQKLEHEPNSKDTCS